MVDTYLELNGDPRHDKNIRRELGIKTHRVRTFFKVLLSVLFVATILAGNVVIFHNLYYKSFFVNGQSMYPTLNGDATCSNGAPIGVVQGCPDDGSIVEYGIMDTHQIALDDIRRFDIIVTTYSELDDKDKIKRVVALPGETFYMIDNAGTAVNGDLYVIPEGESEGVLISQPIRDEFKIQGVYTTCSEPRTLADDEYYVLGDNRAHSDDSRGHGPIKTEFIKGRAIAIEGTCTLVCPSGGVCHAENIRFHWPRFLR